MEKVYGVGSQVGVMLPYSRNHETEADQIGLIDGNSRI
jgi:Zn-dependent protease with chaperone function